MNSNLKISFQYLLATLLIFLGVFLMLGGLINMFPDDAPPHITVSDVFMFVVLGIVPCVLGIVMFFRLSKKRQEAQKAALEQDILKLAKSFHNKLTASDVAIKLIVQPDEADELLRAMVVKGWARLEISDSGVSVYNFHTLISGKEKRDALEI